VSTEVFTARCYAKRGIAVVCRLSVIRNLLMGQLSVDCCLFVDCVDAPIISLQYGHVTVSSAHPLIVVENSSLTVSCSVNAYPPVDLANVTWYKDAAITGQSHRLTITISNRGCCLSLTICV